jgi:hypothetical protein
MALLPDTNQAAPSIDSCHMFLLCSFMPMRSIWSVVELAALSDEDLEALRARAMLSDFYYRDRFVAICGKCRKGKIIHPTRLKKRYGNERVSRLERKLKCSGCGNIRGNWFLLAEAED